MNPPLVPLTFLAVLAAGSTAGWLVAQVLLLGRAKASPAQRHLAWLVAFVIAAATALAACAPWHWRWAVLPEEKPTPVRAVEVTAPPTTPRAETPVLPPAPPTARETTIAPAKPGAIPFTETPSATLRPERPAFSWATALSLLWLLGAVTVWTASVAGMIGLARLRRTAREAEGAAAEAFAELRAGQRARLYFSSRVRGPLAAGVLRPCLIFPEAARDWPAEHFRAAVLHELAHVRRGDLATQFFVRLVLGAHWFNPLLWLAGRRLRAEAERAADDEASQRDDAYAAGLVAVARNLTAGAPRFLPAIGLESGSQFPQRVERLLDPRRNRRSPSRLLCLTAIVAAVALAGGALIVRLAPRLGEPPGLTLTGIVTTSQGAPLEGARVFLPAAVVRQGTSPLCPYSYPDCAKDATTDRAGRFVFKGLDPALKFSLLTVKAGFGSSIINDVMPEKSPVTVKLAPRLEKAPAGHALVQGSVVDEQGRPVVGALVEPYCFGQGDTTTYSGADDYYAITDENGRFVFTTGNKADWIGVQVSAPGFAPRKVRDQRPGVTDNAPVVLNPGVTVRGQLLRDGRPVPRASVAIVQVDRNSESFVGEKIIATDDDGRFVLKNVLPDSRLALYGMRESLPPGGITETRLLRTAAPGTEIDTGALEVVPGVEMTIRFAPPEGVTIPPGTRVLIGREPAWEPILRTVDAEGKITLPGQPGEEWQISIDLPGYVLSPANPQYRGHGERTYVTVANQPETITLALDPAGQVRPPSDERIVSGRVLTPQGQPAAGAVVNTAVADGYAVLIQDGRLRGSMMERRFRAKADALGRFTLSAPREKAALYVEHESGYAIMPIAQVDADIKLQPWARAEGVILERGQPLAGRKVSIGYSGNNTPGEPSFFFRNETTTDAQGRYVLDRLITGLAWLSHRDANASTLGSPLISIPITPVSGETTHLDLGREGAEVRGRVELPEGWQRGRDWDVGEAELYAMPESHFIPPHNVTAEEAQAAYQAYERSPAGLEDFRQRRSYRAPIADDGSFVIPDVPTARYTVNGRLMVNGPANSIPQEVALSERGPDLIVDATASTQRSVLTVPPLTLQPKERPVQPGEMAPAFSFTTRAGETHRSEEFQGRVVLLRFNVVVGAGAEREEAEFAKLVRDLGRSGHLTVVDVDTSWEGDSYTKRPDPTESYWYLCHSTPREMGKTGLTETFRIEGNPYYILIDRTGKVLLSRYYNLPGLRRDMEDALTDN